jgi:uncharacterized protein (TIGR02466 family)
MWRASLSVNLTKAVKDRLRRINSRPSQLFMAKTDSLFVTKLFRAELTASQSRALNADLEMTAYALANDDTAGQRWCKAHGYAGYTSYGSLNDLPWRASVFQDLAKILDRHAKSFAKSAGFDLQGRALELDSLWVNILPPGGTHSGHIHPHCVISGTYYVTMPQKAAALKLEDPRLPMMMAAPPRQENAARDMQPFVYIAPKAGTVLMWESWLRHEVPVNQSKTDRISISFNYRWAEAE